VGFGHGQKQAGHKSQCESGDQDDVTLREEMHKGKEMTYGAMPTFFSTRAMRSLRELSPWIPQGVQPLNLASRQRSIVNAYIIDETGMFWVAASLYTIQTFLREPSIISDFSDM
jgi:hypothetical protein